MGIKRRAFALSDSSDELYDQVTGVGTIEHFAASLDPYRVAPQGHIPMPWPFLASRSSPPVDELLISIESQIRDILQLSKIDALCIIPRLLTPQGDYDDRETIIVITRDDSTETWKEAATQIHLLVRREIRHRKLVPMNISVEIRNFDKMYRDTSYSIPFNSPAHKLFKSMQKRVEELVEMHCVKTRCISYHMRARRDEWEKEIPTILITINPGTKAFWEATYLQILTGLERFADSGAPDFQVELMPGRVKDLVSADIKPLEPINLQGLSQHPRLGSSIGPGNCRAAGSLGAWVYYKEGGDDPAYEKHACFLTCYHVIREGEKDRPTRDHNDDFGIGLQNRPVGTPIKVMYPAQIDAAHTKRILTQGIQKEGDEDESFKNTLGIIENNMTADCGIGTVFRASGYNHVTEDGKRMDWALVKLTDPTLMKQNNPISSRELESRMMPNTMYTLKDTSVISKVGYPFKGEFLLKKGRNGVTTGEVNAMRSQVHWIDQPASHEIDIVPVRGSYDFARSGDAGSMVYNADGEWVGMVIGFSTYTESVCITSAKDIIADVLARTGGDITLAVLGSGDFILLP